MAPLASATAERPAIELSETLSDMRVLLYPDRPSHAPTPLNPSRTFEQGENGAQLSYPLNTVRRLEQQQEQQLNQLNVPPDIARLVAETIYAVHYRRVFANDSKRPYITEGDFTNADRYVKARTGHASPRELIELLAETGYERTAEGEEDFKSVELVKLSHVGSHDTDVMDNAAIEAIMDIAADNPEALNRISAEDAHSRMKVKRFLFGKHLTRADYGEHREDVDTESLRAMNVVRKEPLAKLSLSQDITIVRRESYTLQLHDKLSLPNGLLALATGRANLYLEDVDKLSEEARDAYEGACAQYDAAILDIIEAACNGEEGQLPSWLIPTTTSMYAHLDV